MSVKPSKATQSTTVRKFRFIFVSTFVLSSVSWDILFYACLLKWLVDLGRVKAIFVSSWSWYCKMNPLCITLKSGDRWDFNQKWLAFHGEGGKSRESKMKATFSKGASISVAEMDPQCPHKPHILVQQIAPGGGSCVSRPALTYTIAFGSCRQKRITWRRVSTGAGLEVCKALGADLVRLTLQTYHHLLNVVFTALCQPADTSRTGEGRGLDRVSQWRQSRCHPSLGREAAWPCECDTSLGSLAGANEGRAMLLVPALLAVTTQMLFKWN